MFCWTRFGTEAGEPIEHILERKELERRSNDGLFLWGIGNSVAPAMAELVERLDRPEVLFSAIRSRPRTVDLRPARVVTWRAGLAMNGNRYELPDSVHVTSRAPEERIPASHYALVCRSSEPLEISDHGRVAFCGLRNLRSGSQLGASQVTAVVRRVQCSGPGSEYVIALRAWLVFPYFVRLIEPAVLSMQDCLAALRLQPAA